MTKQHTALPWELRGNEIVSTTAYMMPPRPEDGEEGVLVTVINLTGAMGGLDGDAEFVVRACNNHEQLVAAANSMREQFRRHTCKHHGPMVCDKCEALNALDAALKLAGE